MVWTWPGSTPIPPPPLKLQPALPRWGVHRVPMKCWGVLDVGGPTFILPLLFLS